jgi:hypothetical protein
MMKSKRKEEKERPENEKAKKERIGMINKEEKEKGRKNPARRSYGES